jgi:hypothetical protein
MKSTPLTFLDMSYAELGQVVITPGALRALAKDPDDVLYYLDCHISGDYCVEEKYDDEDEEGELVGGVSWFRLTSGEELCIDTDRKRKTTVMLGDEYYKLWM